MTTTCGGTPTLRERFLEPALIVDGRVEKAVQVRADPSGDRARMQTVFRVKVENILKGEIAQTSINVRVLGGGAEEADTDWSTLIREGNRVMLLLAPDYGSDRAANMFVPFLSTR